MVTANETTAQPENAESRIYPGEKPWLRYEYAPHPLQSLDEDYVQIYDWLLDILWDLEDKESIRRFKMLLHAFEAAYIPEVQ